jgi:hypothetical protein
MLGVTSQVTIACLPRYALHERVWRVPVEEALAGLAENVATNDHFEFFWYPGADIAECKALNPSPEQPAGEEPPPLDGPGERVGWSHRIYPSVREQRFNEMEYSVPAEAGPECFRAVREVMRTQFPKWGWPVEYRTLAADDAMLSPAFQRETVTISVHQDARRPYEEYFRAVEPIFRAHEGRPPLGQDPLADARRPGAALPRMGGVPAGPPLPGPAGPVPLSLPARHLRLSRRLFLLKDVHHTHRTRAHHVREAEPRAFDLAERQIRRATAG